MSTDQISLTPQCRLLYGNPGVNVQVLTLKPGQRYTSPAGSAMTQEWVVMSGQVTMTSDGEAFRLRAGKYGNHRGFLPGQAVAVENPSTKNAAKLLVVSRYQNNGNPQIAAAGPVTETRPWGNFTVLADEPDFKLKELVVTPGGRLSLQRHEKRSEHWFILQGNPEITTGRQKTVYQPGDYVHIPRHAWHRIDNRAGKENVVLVELQTGTYFGEDDIERKQDDYGRN